MDLDQLLSRASGARVAEEVRALRRPGPIEIDGVSSSRGTTSSFSALIDEDRELWSFTLNGVTSSFANGTLSDADGQRDSVTFARTIPQLVRLSAPDRLPIWGRGPESFHPILIQEVPEGSLLFTFEHREQPAFRTTLSVDRSDGVARVLVDQGITALVHSVRAF